MTTQQGLRQQSVRDVTGTTGTYNEDWHALFDDEGIATGPFDQRLLIWINARLGTNYTELNGAMAAFAADEGVGSFSAIGTFTASSGAASVWRASGFGFGAPQLQTPGGNGETDEDLIILLF